MLDSKKVSQVFIANLGQTNFRLTQGSYVLGVGNLEISVDGKEVDYHKINQINSTDFSIPAVGRDGAIVDVNWTRTTEGEVGSLTRDINALTIQMEKSVTILADIELSVRQLGAVGDGIKDDTKAIKDTISLAVSRSYLEGKFAIRFPSCVGYRVTEEIVVPHNVEIIMNAPIVVDHEGIGMTIGNTTASTWVTSYRLSARKKAISTWDSEESVGFKILNADSCEINITQAYGFTLGVQLWGDKRGFAYNTLTLGYLTSNKIALDMRQQGMGWINENLFINGRFAIGGSINRNKSRYGVRMKATDPDHGHNNNVFLKPSFELYASSLLDGAEAIGMLFENASQNEVISCRSEGNTLAARFMNNSTENKMTIGYGFLATSDFEDVSNFPNNVVIPSRKRYLSEVNTLCFMIDNLADRWNPYDANNDSFRGLSVLLNSGVITNNARMGVIKQDDWVTWTGVGSYIAVGVMVDTKDLKSFVIKSSYADDIGSAHVFKCFGDDGLPLGAGHVKGTANRGIPYADNRFGGAYVTGNSLSEAYLRVSKDVKKVFVGTFILPGNSKLKGFSLYSSDKFNSPAISSGTGKPLSTEHVALAPPTRGTWEAGRRIINDKQTVGQPKAWVCTAAGTPGVWTSEGNL